MKTLLAACLSVLAGSAYAENAPSSDEAGRQALDDAWWTGPVLAAGAGTLPKGRVLFEPYIYDAITYGHYDNSGTRQSSSRTHSFGSQSYLLYGLTNKVTVGLIPRFGYNDVEQGLDSSGIRVGDLTLQAQYRLSLFSEGRRIPTISLVLQKTFPTGKHDELGARLSDGLGSGAYSTTLAIYSQYYSWLPNGRILRTRFNVSRTISENADLQDVSVYGTPQGFRGTASPGGSLSIVAAGEYSLTRNWVFAMDLLYQHDNNTRVQGNLLNVNYGSSKRIGVVPAVEYNWSGRAGVIVGARWIADGRNADASITPVTAINLVF